MLDLHAHFLGELAGGLDAFRRILDPAPSLVSSSQRYYELHDFLPESCFLPKHLCADALVLTRRVPHSGLTATGGPDWIHEIKHDGFRILARREAARVRLYTRNDYNFTARFPKIAATVETLPVRSCLLDGEAIVVDERGLSVFEALRYRTHDHAAILCAFDLLELDGADFRSQPLEQHKASSPIYYAVSLTASPSTGSSAATAR
jgi:hypothetical protein